MNKEALTRLAYLASNSEYNEDNKTEFRKLGRKFLNEIVKEMGLKKGEYDIRWNPGGPAVSGDYTLHTDWFYLALTDNLNMGWFYYRQCEGRKDYCGKINRQFYWDSLIKDGVKGLVNAINSDCPKP